MRYILVILNSALISFFCVQIPDKFGQIIDNFTAGNSSPFFLISLLLLIGGAEFLTVFNGYLMRQLGIEYAGKMQRRLITKYFFIDQSKIEDYSVGKYRQLFSTDVKNVQQFFNVTIPLLLQQSITFVLALYFVGKLNFWLLIFVLMPMCTYFLPTKLFNKKQHQFVSQYRKLQIDSQTLAENSFANRNEIYQLNNHAFFTKKFARIQAEWGKKLLTVDVSKNIFKTFPRTLDALTPALVLLVGGQLFLNKVITLGQLVSVLGYIAYINAPFKNLFMMIIELKQAQVSKKALSKYSNLIEILFGKQELGQIQRIEIFSHNEKIVALTPGMHVFIIGKTGSGKTTLLRQLCGYQTHLDFKVFCNGQELKKFKRTDFIQQLAFVTQQSVIIPATLAENVFLDGFGKLTPLEEAFFLKWATRFEDGIATKVGAGGVELSGGEQQIICLLRSLAQDAKFLLLDEVTASLDTDLAKKVAELIAARKDLIILEILHRVERISPDERVLYFNDGQLVYQKFAVTEGGD